MYWITEDAQVVCNHKLGKVQKRCLATHNIPLHVDDAVFQAIADRCKEVQSGARNVDHILRGTIMPLVSHELLSALSEEADLKALRLSVKPDGQLLCTRE